MNTDQKKGLIHETTRIHSKAPTLLDWDNLPELLNLGRQSKKHHRICEQYSNGDLTEEEYTTRIEKLENNITRNVNRLKERTKINLQTNFQHDPRGLTVGIYIQKKPNENYQLYHILGWE